VLRGVLLESFSHHSPSTPEFRDEDEGKDHYRATYDNKPLEKKNDLVWSRSKENQPLERVEMDRRRDLALVQISRKEFSSSYISLINQS
jgi:hypothetical protein